MENTAFPIISIIILFKFPFRSFRREAIMNNDTKGGCLAIVLGNPFILGPHCCDSLMA